MNLTPTQKEVVEELRNRNTPLATGIANSAEYYWSNGRFYPRRVLVRGIRRKFETANKEAQNA